MATLHERYKMKSDAALRQKVTSAVQDKALRTLRESGSTAPQKADALKRLHRDIDDREWALLVTLIGATYSSTPSDEEIQAAVEQLYASLPGP